jgi:hypothetical protein
MKFLLTLILFISSINLFSQDTCTYLNKKNKFFHNANWYPNPPDSESVIILPSLSHCKIKDALNFNTFIIYPNASVTIKQNIPIKIDTVHLLTDGSFTGELITSNQFTNDITTVQKLFTSREWHQTSIPVQTLTPNIYRSYYYIEPNDYWTRLITPEQTTPYKAYDFFYTNNTYVTFSGPLFLEKQYEQSTSYTPNFQYSGWELISNPYTSAIDAASISMINIEQAISVWNPNTDQYQQWVNGVSNNNGSNIIPITQGFWVRTLPNLTGTITISKSDQVINQDQPILKSAIPTTKISILNSEITIYEDLNGSSNFSSSLDARR